MSANWNPISDVMSLTLAPLLSLGEKFMSDVEADISMAIPAEPGQALSKKARTVITILAQAFHKFYGKCHMISDYIHPPPSTPSNRE